MKKNSILALLLLLFTNQVTQPVAPPCRNDPEVNKCGPYVAVCENNCCKNRHHSFITTRPTSQNIAAWQASWHDYIYDKHGALQTSFQAMELYQQSVEVPKMNSYFLFCGLEQLYIAGDEVVSNENSSQRDVRAEWLNLPANFQGTLSLRPSQKQIGFSLELHQNASAITSHSLFSDYWVDIVVPVIVVKNHLNLQQAGVLPAGQNLAETFAQPDWRFAKFSEKQRTKAGIGDIILRFGRAFLNEDYFQVIYYSGCRIPVGGEQSAEWTFDPVVGNNGHLSLITGVNFQLPMTSCDSRYHVAFFLNIENNYFAKNNQWRTIDLKGRPWSRYMLLNKRDGGPEQNIPAVNVLTRQVSVHPHNVVDLSAGLRVIRNDVEFEFGYDLWAHAREKVELNHCFPLDWGIAGVRDDMHPGFTTTASASTINRLAANDVDAEGNPVFVPIRKGDLDLNSAGSEGQFTNKVHITLGMGHRGECVDIFANIGAFYEVPTIGTALEIWGVWFKFGGQF